MKPRKKRIIVISIVLLGVSLSAGLILTSFEKNLMYFYSPTDVINGEAQAGRNFRIGGLVLEGTVKRNPNNLKVSFILTDTINEVEVQYDGILPDLFREGQGIVANGILQPDNIFIANQVLAKHDENYMPPEVADALEKAKNISPNNLN